MIMGDEFDRMVSELLNEWIYDDDAEYSFDDARIIGEENLEIDDK
jgi:hypothetical protein